MATGAGVNLTLEPIYSQSVWGAGWYNAASSAHYADSAIRYEGNIDIELQFGASGNIWKWIDNWVVRHRAYPTYGVISTDGVDMYTYDPEVVEPVQGGLYNTSAGFSTSENSFVTCSLGALALNRVETATESGAYLANKFGYIANAHSDLAVTMPLNPEGASVNPIPFWRTTAALKILSGGTEPCLWTPFDEGDPIEVGLETVEWSVDVSQNQVVVYTCNGNRLPSAVMMGPMDVTGNVVLFNQDGVFDPILGPTSTGTITSPYLYANNTVFVVQIDGSTPTESYMAIPAVVIESDDYGIAGNDSVTNRTFSLKGLGGRGYTDLTLPPFIMSDYGTNSVNADVQAWTA